MASTTPPSPPLDPPMNTLRDINTSVKGIFAFKGKKLSARTEDYVGDGSSPKNGKEIFYVFLDLWEKINERIQVMQSDLNTKIFEDLLYFIQTSHGQFQPTTDRRYGSLEIPTAALVTGVNMPDHAVMFGNLMSMLKASVTPFTAVLHSKDCATVKSIMSKTISQLMQNTEMHEDEEDEEELTTANTSTKRMSSVMSVLGTWYRDVGKRCASPRKRNVQGASVNKSTVEYPPVVIVLEDLESFPPNVLQDFITICSNHLNELPLVLVFGIATTVTAVHALLPHRVSSLLCMEKFQAPPSTNYLSHVIQEVLLTADLPFKLGSKVFLLLLDIFLYHDFSVINFIRGLQFSMLDHFTSPSALLCQSIDELEDVVSVLSHDHLEHLRSQMSFRRFVESRSHKEQISLLEDDAYTKKIVMMCMEKLNSYHQCFFPVLNCLHTFTNKLPGAPVGKQIREQYAMCLSSPLGDTPEYKEALLLLRTFSRDEMVSLLRQCCGHFTDNVALELLAVRSKLQDFSDKFQDVERLQQEKDDEVEAADENEDTSPQKATQLKKMDMYTLRQTLQSMDSKKKKLSVYEVLRHETVDYLDLIFRRYLLCPTKLPLHEVLYYNNVSAIKNHINGSPRATIQNALSNPHFYVQVDSMKTDLGTISSSLPDLCIVYKLHLECGRLINLYDWLQAYVTIVTSTDDDEEEDVSKRKPDQILQARFIQAVSELQFLGFVKPTKRKTDHVARLTWGGC